MKKREMIRKTACICVVLVLLFGIGYSGLRMLESTVFSQTQTGDGRDKSKTILHNGVPYFPRQDITVIMLMGIDEKGPVEDSGSYNNSGEADWIILLICDEKDEKIRFLNINRDTMLEIPVLGLDGRQVGSVTGQLALAHTYGSGLEDSCENTREAVANFLNGLRIDYYVSMNMDAVAILNDAVGGVTVNVREDFSQVDATIPMGTVTLMGQQALNYVRCRKDVGSQLNLNRMERQKAYVVGFVEALRETREKQEDFVAAVYEQVAPYMVSDLPVSSLSAMLDRYAGYEAEVVLTLEGDNVRGEEYYEFYPDEEQKQELILRLFYGPKPGVLQ